MFDLKNIRTAADNDPRYYVLTEEGLKKAVNMSIWLQKPLLLTGAPGTGKTQLAAKVSYELSNLKDGELKGCAPFVKQPLIFDTKTTCSASDLFYTYDAIGHFQRRNNEAGATALSAHSYIKLNALGKAILQTHGKKAIRQDEHLRELAALNGFEDLMDEPASSVVLIDEIDKAPRDFPNDLLAEIEHLRFTINELSLRVKRTDPATAPARIVVFMTSNFEKNLPDAFLRRCLFYHIPSPAGSSLLEIVCSRMKPYFEQLSKNGESKNLDEDLKLKIEKTITKFEQLRNTMVDKQPSTAELLEWIKVLELEGFYNKELDFNNLSPEQQTIFRYTLPIIAKSEGDLKLASGNR